jgi:hypothetical protein
MWSTICQTQTDFQELTNEALEVLRASNEIDSDDDYDDNDDDDVEKNLLSIS